MARELAPMSSLPVERDYDVGYGKTPESSRFKKGQSGNSRGRPKGSKRSAPYDTVLGQMVTVREAGRERRITAAEAFLLLTAKRGLEGDGAAARAAMAAIEQARARHTDPDNLPRTIVFRSSVRPGSVNSALEPLRMATKLDRYRETARMMLEPWLVEAALARLGSQRLTREQQDTVIRATRLPGKVRWPDWWEVLA
jgi:hypothetical protein